MGEDLLEIEAEFFRAIAHPTRIEILELLRQGEHCVHELIEALGEKQANLSQHLAILRKQGLVVSRKDGVKRVYSVPHPEVFRLISTASAILEKRLHETAAVLSNLKASTGVEARKGAV